jgi:hypothetical protein
MGGTVSRIFSPGAAKFMVSNTNSALLKSALQNYIKAVNNLNINARTENKLIAMMNNTRIGLTNSYKKRIANSIASIVAKAPRVAAKAAEAAAGAAPVTPAAVAVNNLANQINNLNNRISQLAALAGPPGTAPTTPANMARLYMTKKYNNSANRAINTAGKYASIWAAINALKTSAPINRTLLNAVLAKTTNQKLRANITNRIKSEALMKELRTTAAAAGVNLKNKNVSEALNRIIKYESLVLLPKAEANKAAANKAAANKAARAAINKLWGFAGTGSNSNKNETITQARSAATRARARGELNLNGLTRAQLNAILASNTFKPSSNQTGGNKNRHVARVKKILNSLYAPLN